MVELPPVPVELARSKRPGRQEKTLHPPISHTVRASEPRRDTLRLWIALAVMAVLAAFAVGLFIDFAVYRDRVHGGVSVCGVDLGGLKRGEAIAALEAHVTQAQDVPLELIAAQKTFEVRPADVAAQPDVARAVAAALDVTRRGNLVVDLARRIGLWFHGEDVPMEGTIDRKKLNAVVAGIAEQIDLPAVPAGLEIEDGEATLVEGRTGNVINRPALSAQMSALLLSFQASQLTIPMTVVEPLELAKDSDEAVEAAEAMISAPVKLTSGERVWTLSPEDIAAYLDVDSDVDEGVATIAPFLSAAKMAPLLTEIAGVLDRDPKDAYFKSNGEMAWAEPGEMGRAVDHRATADALTAAALESGSRTAKVVMVEVEPDLTAKEANAMGISARLGHYQTKYECPAERQQNVRVTTQYADKILAPGEVYNFDRQIGPRTEERGFALAPGIVGKGALEDVLGGGICQVSTTIFNAALEAGLEIIERHNHSLYIDHYPAGRDATVTDGGKNLRFRNDTDHYVWVHGWSDGVTTVFNIYGTDDGREVEITWSGWEFGEEMRVEKYPVSSLEEGQTVIERAGQAARSCTITRTVTMPDGTVLHNGPELFTSEFKMISRVIQIAPPPTTTTTTLPGTSTTTLSPGAGTTTTLP